MGQCTEQNTFQVTQQWLLRSDIVLLFIYSACFYSASSSPLLLRGAPNAARMLCWSFTLRHHRQLRVKDLPKVPTWRPEWDLNPRPFGRKATNLPMSHHTPHEMSYSGSSWCKL